MLTDLIFYDLKVAALIAVFYLFYMLLLARETTHTLNRAVLLSGIALSVVLPLCIITFHRTEVVEYSLPSVTVASNVSAAMPQPMEQSFDWTVLLTVILLSGTLLRLVFIALSYRILNKMIRDSEKHTLQSGTRVCVVDAPIAPFSWMRNVVLSRADWLSQSDSILAHEEAHVRHHHSYDVVVVEVLTALQWFNPVVWFLRQELRTLHEYEADASVLSHGFDESQYIHLLMQKATGIKACALANGIHTPKTKKRIIMMLKTKSKRSTWLKALYIVPIVLVSLAMSAKTVTDYEVRTPQKKTVVKKGRKEAQVKMSGTTIEVKTEAETTADRPFALHAVVDQYGRITGLSSEGAPDSRQPLEFTIGRIFFDDHVATLEEVKNRKSLGYELYEIIHRPNSAGNPRWNYKDKEGILVFHQKKQEAKDAQKLIFGESNGPEPLLVLDGKVATKEQVKALDQSTIDHINVVKYSEDKKDLLFLNGDKFNTDTSNLIIFVNTKDYVKNGGSKELVSARVKAKKTQKEEKVFDVVENMPSFPGGTVKMMEYLSTNVRYPEAALKVGAQGRVVVNFIVEPDGTISNANVVRSVSEELDAEAIRVVENMPKWKPGMQNGKVVRVKYSIPVSFRLN